MKVEDRSGMKLIGIMGLARSGKTTVSDYLQLKYGFRRHSFADRLKEMMIQALDRAMPPDYCWHSTVKANIGPNRFMVDELHWRRQIYHDRTPFTRWLLQFVGTEVFRDQVDGDYWIKEWLRVYYQTPGDIVVPDVRFPNEAACLKRMGGEIWRVVRKDWEGSIEHGAGHRSETEAEAITADRIIEAPSGIENLHKAVDEIALGPWGLGEVAKDE